MRRIDDFHHSVLDQLALGGVDALLDGGVAGLELEQLLPGPDRAGDAAIVIQVRPHRPEVLDPCLVRLLCPHAAHQRRDHHQHDDANSTAHDTEPFLAPDGKLPAQMIIQTGDAGPAFLDPRRMPYRSAA
ncbi:MAG: hypothetical protein HYU66_08050 [Armatimonadetes bacterium]|nr:hypothetical protein [Armatimonadota bacterium]